MAAGFHEIEFPVDISYGSRGGPGWRTDIAATAGGDEQRDQRWQNARHYYDVKYGVKTRAQGATIRRFYHGRRGAAHGFRYKDWDDHTTHADGVTPPSQTDSILTAAATGGTTQLQLVKVYADAVLPWTRALQKVEASSVLVEVDTVLQAQGPDYAVDPSTGLVTFTSAFVGGEVVKAGCEFRVPCRFGEEADEAMEFLLTAFDIRDLPSIPVVEDFEPGIAQGDYFPGGAHQHGDMGGSTVNVVLGQGMAQTFNPTTPGGKGLLPAAADLEYGGPWFHLQNLSGSDSVDVRRNDDGASVHVLSAGAAVELWVMPNASGNKAWHAFF
jgi:uncharacterized protein (TIGR02217 family)